MKFKEELCQKCFNKRITDSKIASSKMGNDQSQLKGLQIDQKAIEVTDFWSIYAGEVPNGSNNAPTLISIFKGEPVVTGQLWKSKSPLERATKNLMIYRHPHILRFITSWDKGSTHYLATERCRPLSMILSTQNDIQICLGLRNILCSLIFLVERANVCHLNVCTSSIYVAYNGAWRLNGFEHLWPKKDVTNGFLQSSQTYRYQKAIDKNESKRESVFGVEQLAFGVLCEEILNNKKSDSKLPHVTEFRKYCAEHLCNAKAEMRPTLSAILLHPYFNQDFVTIHSFLSELPLKSLQEKQSFFTSLVDRLRAFDEAIVASELINLILSRMVVLDDTAKMCVIPFVLRPRTECDSLNDPTPLFSVETFRKFVSPKIQQLFLVRDVSTRLILLEYFPEYVHYMEKDSVLTQHVLPQILLGIKDTNDILVAATLRCLADLVPILGSSVVIGSNRGRLFSDGRPNGSLDSSMVSTTSAMPRFTEARSITPVMNGVEMNFLSASPLPDAVDISDSFVSATASQPTPQNNMPERLSPDGGEDIATASEQPDIELEDEDEWSDWETDNNQQMNTIAGEQQSTIATIESNGDYLTSSTTNQTVKISNTQSTTNDINDVIRDIKNIEIKVTKTQTHDEIDDFFKDMEPIITKTNQTLVLLDTFATNDPKNDSIKSNSNEFDIKIDQNRFAMKTTESDDAFADAAWGNETGDWDVDS